MGGLLVVFIQVVRSVLVELGGKGGTWVYSSAELPSYAGQLTQLLDLLE